MKNTLVYRKLDVLDSEIANIVQQSLFSPKLRWEFHFSKLADLEGEFSHSIFFWKSQLQVLEGYLSHKLFKDVLDDYINLNSLHNAPISMYDAYINCHPSYHPGGWHTDISKGQGITLLYYPDVGVNYLDGGGTEIEGHGIEQYIPNSCIVFPGQVKHRALEHTVPGAYRFSIAFKYLLH